jgi:predicted NAD/FAD-dependent oxidoreductase
MISEVAQWLGGDVARYQIHRWRYSQVIQGFGESFAALDKPGPLFLFGDAFGGNRVEGAFLSGYSAGSRMIDYAKDAPMTVPGGIS